MWALLYECGRQGNFLDAENLLLTHPAWAKQRRSDPFLVACGESGDLENARHWVSAVESLSGGHSKGVSFMSFLEGCAKAAQLDLAKAWWRSMEEDWDIQVERKHYDALISACRNDFKEAQR
ncbi:unnamed protein product, partial [Durusdinium trenchii]